MSMFLSLLQQTEVQVKLPTLLCLLCVSQLCRNLCGPETVRKCIFLLMFSVLLLGMNFIYLFTY
jgi:hypothetical protein